MIKFPYNHFNFVSILHSPKSKYLAKMFVLVFLGIIYYNNFKVNNKKY